MQITLARAHAHELVDSGQLEPPANRSDYRQDTVIWIPGGGGGQEGPAAARGDEGREGEDGKEASRATRETQRGAFQGCIQMLRGIGVELDESRYSVQPYVY